MVSKYLINGILKFFFWYFKLIGMFPLHYDSYQKKFRSTKFEILYSISVWLNFIYFYLTRAGPLMAPLSPMLIYGFFYLSLITVIFVFIMQFLNTTKIVTLLNETRVLFKQIDSGCKPISNGLMILYSILFMIKMFFVSGTGHLSSIYNSNMMCKLIYGQPDYFALVSMALLFSMQTTVSNMFYTFALGVIIKYQQLNCEIREIVDKATVIFVKKRKYNDIRAHSFNQYLLQLSGRLDRAAYLHGKLTLLIARVNEIFSLQMLVVTGNFYVIFLIQVSIF